MKNLSARDQKRLIRLRQQTLRMPEALDDQAIQAGFAERFAAHGTVGGTVGLLQGGQLVKRFAYGKARLSPEVPATKDTLYRVASVSKLVFTYAAMALVEQGRLQMDGDISEVLGYPVRHPGYPDTPLTLRQLLTHTASLLDAPQYDGPGISGKLALRQMLSAQEGRPNFAVWQPGTTFRYSNFGAGIVGSMMEIVTGERFADVVRRLVLAPLAVTGSFAPQMLAGMANRVANGYAVRPLRRPRLAYDAATIIAEPLPPVNPEYDFMASPGRLVVDIQGLAALLSLLCSDGRGIVSEDSLAEMRSLQDGKGSVTGNCGRGLNVAFVPAGILSDRPAIGHQGVAYGMNAEAWIDPETRDGVVMATSGTNLGATCDFVRTGFAVVGFGFAVLNAWR